MSDAAQSRRLLQQSRRPSWRSNAGAEETRAYLQRRLELFWRVMFWSFVVLRALEVLLYLLYPIVQPHLYAPIVVTGVASLALLAACWRIVLVRRDLDHAALDILDIVMMAGTGIVFGGTAILAYDRSDSAFVCMLYGCLMVFTRVLFIPSSPARTAVASGLTLIPLVIAGVVLALETEQDLPGPAFFGAAFMYCGIAIAIATIGSRTIYGLRRRVDETMQLGQYTLERRIGGGQLGELHFAQHALLRRPTAIKLIRPERLGEEVVARFEQDVQRMSQLTHPNAVAVFDYGHSPDGVFYYAMEYLDGLDLESLVARHGPQPPARVIGILVQMCGALQEAHDLGLLHRDVKPANVFLCERGGMPDVSKLVDFGLVPRMPHAPRIFGTPGYAAPEILAEDGAIGPAVNLYALGAVGYFLLTGRRVFEAHDPEKLCDLHLRAAPEPLSVDGALPAELVAIVMQCLAKRPERRPVSARDVARRLRAVPAGDDWNVGAARTWWRTFSGAKPVAG